MRDATAERNMPRYIDGADTERLHSNDRVRINKARETVRLVKLSKESFMKTMREKMKGN